METNSLVVTDSNVQALVNSAYKGYRSGYTSG